MLNGHRFLWLPWKIGRPIVNYSVLIFAFTLITGMVLWWPKKWNKSTRKKSFGIKWRGTIKRINYDLHNVLGFYSLLILLAIALTGIVYGIEWFSKSSYWLTSGGKYLPAYQQQFSDSSAVQQYTPEQAMDITWAKVITENPSSQGFYVNVPSVTDPTSTIYITVYPSRGKFYNTKSYVFDQHTLQQLNKKDFYSRDFKDGGFGDKLRRMNYDIHVGSILGFPGKCLAFLFTLIGASLPVTGFIIWWGKKKKQWKKEKKKQSKMPTAH